MKLLIQLFIISCSIICILPQANSQNINDAIRYSSLIPGSTARAIGTSSIGAMGGDFGVLAINPAGLGDYRSSELVFSFSFNTGSTESQLLSSLNTQNTSHSTQPNIENIGLVLHKSPTNGKLVTSNFAVGLQQYNTFNENFAFNGQTEGSIVERFLELAEGLTIDELDNFEAGLAYDAGAIFDFDEDGTYESDFIDSDIVNKSQTVDRSGKINELTIAWGGKFRNNLNIGVSVGIPFVSFEEERAYFENDPTDVIPFFERLTFTERLSTSGTGVNIKAGIGYTIKRVLRLGLSYQSPSFIKFDDNFDTQFEYSFSDTGTVETFSSGSPDGRFDYRLRTPSRITASIGGLLNLGDIKGFINLDGQFINYANNSFNLTAFSDNQDDLDFQEALNAQISEDLQSAVNINLGAELVYKKFRVRSGIGIIGNPSNTGTINESNTLLSAGLGYRANRIFIDASYQRRQLEEEYVPYLVIDSSRLQNVSNTATISKFTVTIGYKI